MHHADDPLFECTRPRLVRMHRAQHAWPGQAPFHTTHVGFSRMGDCLRRNCKVAAPPLACRAPSYGRSTRFTPSASGAGRACTQWSRAARSAMSRCLLTGSRVRCGARDAVLRTFIRCLVTEPRTAWFRWLQRDSLLLRWQLCCRGVLQTANCSSEFTIRDHSTLMLLERRLASKNAIVIAKLGVIQFRYLSPSSRREPRRDA